MRSVASHPLKSGMRPTHSSVCRACPIETPPVVTPFAPNSFLTGEVYEEVCLVGLSGALRRDIDSGDTLVEGGRPNQYHCDELRLIRRQPMHELRWLREVAAGHAHTDQNQQHRPSVSGRLCPDRALS